MFSTLLTCGEFDYAKATFEEAKQVVTELANQAHMRPWQDDQRFSRYHYDFLNLPNFFLSQSTWMKSSGVIRDDWENLGTKIDSVHCSIDTEIQVHFNYIG